MKTPLKYYGGKQQLLKYILPLIPEHDLFCEPFAGGAAVFFAKEPAKINVINDLNGEVINFYNVIVSDFEALKKEIDKTLCSRENFEVAKCIFKHPNYFTKIKRAWAIWILSRLAFAGDFNNTYGFGKTVNNLVVAFNNSKSLFTTDLKKLLEGTNIEKDDAINVIKRYDTEKSLFFIDPPYYNSDMGHYENMFGVENYKMLLQLLSEIKGKFILTMYPDENLYLFAKKFNWKIHEVQRTITATNKIRNKKRELIVCNF